MLITNATIFTLGEANRRIDNGAIRTEGALIREVGVSAQSAYSKAYYLYISDYRMRWCLLIAMP